MLKTKSNRQNRIRKKLPNVSNLVKKAKITELKSNIPDITNSATKTALTAVENKIPSVNSLVTKTDYATKISEIGKRLTDHNHDKYNTTPDFNTLVTDVFDARLAQANLITKTDFDAKLLSLNRKITANKWNNLLVENELKKLKIFDSSYFIGKSHFKENETQNYLVFQPVKRYFKVIANTEYVSSWKYKGLSAETIKPPTTPDNSLTPAVSYGTKTRVKFIASCLQQPKLLYTYGKVVNIYIFYEFGASSSHNNNTTLKNSLFGAVTLTKNTDIDKYRYSGYGIGFDRRSRFSFPGGGFGQM